MPALLGPPKDFLMLEHMMFRRIVTLGTPEEMDDYDLDLAVKVMGLFHPSVVWKLYLCHKRC